APDDSRTLPAPGDVVPDTGRFGRLEPRRVVEYTGRRRELADHRVRGDLVRHGDGGGDPDRCAAGFHPNGVARPGRPGHELPGDGAGAQRRRPRRCLLHRNGDPWLITPTSPPCDDPRVPWGEGDRTPD